MQYPLQIAIAPLAKPPNATVRVPGSKSITNRALVLAALTDMAVELRGALRSEDTEVMIKALETLGFYVRTNWDRDEVSIGAEEGMPIPRSDVDIHVANTGTSMRFLTALVTLGHGRYRID